MLAFIKKFAARPDATQTVPNEREEGPLTIVNSRKNVLNALVSSLKQGTIVGVYAEALGEGMFLTAVEEIIDEENDKIVGFKRYDASGHILPRTHFALSEIKAVCPLNARYVNPYLSR